MQSGDVLGRVGSAGGTSIIETLRREAAAFRRRARTSRAAHPRVALDVPAGETALHHGSDSGVAALDDQQSAGIHADAERLSADDPTAPPAQQPVPAWRAVYDPGAAAARLATGADCAWVFARPTPYARLYRMGLDGCPLAGDRHAPAATSAALCAAQTGRPVAEGAIVAVPLDACGVGAVVIALDGHRAADATVLAALGAVARELTGNR